MCLYALCSGHSLALSFNESSLFYLTVLGEGQFLFDTHKGECRKRIQENNPLPVLTKQILGSPCVVVGWAYRCSPSLTIGAFTHSTIHPPLFLLLFLLSHVDPCPLISSAENKSRWQETINRTLPVHNQLSSCLISSLVAQSPYQTQERHKDKN